jgi:tRNA threonylcarbamoyladenosine biosynthesis protein TsaE
MKTLQLHSKSAEQTEQYAQALGSNLRGGEVIELVSDLGGGKTTFTRGLAAGADSSDVVASPTFTVSKVYKTDKLEIHHFDFYRLADAGLIAHELQDLLGDPSVVIVVEWGGVVEHVLPEDKVTIEITRTGEVTRGITITYPENRHYLIDAINV